MTIRIFNPEHDIALAANLSNFTAPHAGRQLRHDLGFLPALWAEEGDIVLVDDAEQARRSFHRFKGLASRYLEGSLHISACQFAHSPSVFSSVQAQRLDPWGWDLALKARLLRLGVSEKQLPSDNQLDAIRHLSHRRTAIQLLPCLQREGTLGESFECTSTEEIEEIIRRYGRLVLKAPWSSSGRGLRFVQESAFKTDHLMGWLRNLLTAQGSVIAEPYYNKVKDFGMEFMVSECGEVRYLGLSLFHTANGAYTGNILATESKKREMINRYIPINLLDDIQKNICTSLTPKFSNHYTGPFGVDMMICTSPEGQFLLHPCVEINLRRTMGHVALSLTPTDDDVMRVMRIEYADNNYKLKIQQL
ncbi:MAG: hypothetical protein K2J86_01380 [Prevotella sp.]|nr:hypothetical protein [Prevotella sp.]MDE6688537.1 hypothetical protein [Prevotella sp.]